ncbi:MAG: ATP-binding protein, partial [Chloroflexota bacterium]
MEGLATGTQSFPAAFMRHDVAELEHFPQHGALQILVSLLRKLSPDSLSVMEFKSELDVQIAQKMLRFPLLGEQIAGVWNLKLTAEFHMTNDSGLFKTEPGKGRLPLYEGKMIHQYDAYFAEPRYWVDEIEGRKAVLGRGVKDTGQVLDYQRYRLGFRAIARNTDTRTAIVGPVPSRVFCGNSLLVLHQDDINHKMTNNEVFFAQAALNSFVIDFFLRQMVSANINMFYLYQLPIPRLTTRDPAFAPLVKRAARLICTTPEFDALAKEVGLGSHTAGARDPSERAKLRAEIDGLVAHLYGLTEDEFVHVLNAFPLVAEPVKEAARNAYRDVARGLVK